ncbi:MAG: enoyl-CoA hydratase/isomerase family protein [Promethearchaeia archaeon]
MSNNNNDILFYEIKNKIAYITLNRPDMAHAFNWELMNAFYDALKKADADDKVKCVLIQSTGDRAFSSGIDIKATTPDDQEYIEKMRRIGREINQYILLMKKPTICKVQGSAIGFGFEVVMACDLKIFADKPFEEMKFRMPEIAISIYPQTGATILPLLTFGLTYAKNILLTADYFGLEDLKKFNIPTRIFPPDKLDVETRKFLRTFSKRDYSFSFLIKASLNIMYNKWIKRWFDLEDECGKLAYSKKSMGELDEIIKELYKKYP